MATRPHAEHFYRPQQPFSEMEQVHTLRMLNEAAQKINSILDLDQLLDKIVNEVAIKFGCIETCMWLRDAAAGEMVLSAVQGCTMYTKRTRLRIGVEGMIGHCAATGKTVYAPDVRLDPHYLACEPGIMCELDLPLICDGEVIGVFSVVHHQLDAFSPRQITMLEQLCRHIAVAVKNAQLFSNDRAERDEAHRIQQALFPKASPRVAGYTIEGHCVPAGAVGGDWYDFIALSEGRIGLVLADVAGKGMPAALLMSATRGVLRSVALTAPGPAQALSSLNRFLVSDLPPEKFVTLVYAILDPTRHTLTYANAGHPWPLLVCGDSVNQLQTASGLPLGLIDCEYDEITVELPKGCRVLLYSDGITEATGRGGEEYGVDRLRHRATNGRMSAKDIVEDVCLFSTLHPLVDDATVIAIEREA